MMAHMIAVKVTYTPDDSLRVAKFLRNQEFIYRNDVFLTAGFVFVAFIALIVIMADDFSSIRILGAAIFSAIPAAAVGAAVFILHKVVNPCLMRRTIAKYFDSSPSAGEECTLSLSEEGINAESALSSSFTKWPALAKVVESDSDILFYCGYKMSWFIPKSVFVAQNELDPVKELLRQSLGEKAHLLKR
jgi:hypothetical protein